MNTTMQPGPLEVRLSDLLGNEFGWLTARIDAEMAEYWDGAYADSGGTRDQLERFAAEVMAPLQARIRELTLYAAQVESERDDALADALRAYNKLNGLHVSARAHRDRVRELEAELTAAKANGLLVPGLTICRSDGRCQYAIDHGAEELGHCPRGKCVMPDHGGPVA